jgi:hypothetical protein
MSKPLQYALDATYSMFYSLFIGLAYAYYNCNLKYNENLIQPTISLEMPVPFTDMSRQTIIQRKIIHFWFTAGKHVVFNFKLHRHPICFLLCHTKFNFTLRFTQLSGCWLILSVYILMSFDFPFVRLFGDRLLP